MAGSGEGQARPSLSPVPAALHGKSFLLLRWNSWFNFWPLLLVLAPLNGVWHLPNVFPWVGGIPSQPSLLRPNQAQLPLSPHPGCSRPQIVFVASLGPSPAAPGLSRALHTGIKGSSLAPGQNGLGAAAPLRTKVPRSPAGSPPVPGAARGKQRSPFGSGNPGQQGEKERELKKIKPHPNAVRGGLRSEVTPVGVETEPEPFLRARRVPGAIRECRVTP